MAATLDEKRRVVLPKDIVEDLDLKEGASVVFERRKGAVVMRKARKEKDLLREMMSWNPTRVRKLQPVMEREIKEIWVERD